MKIRIELRQCEAMPKYYGLAWHEYYRNIAVCMPIPLNVIAYILRNVYLWMTWFGKNDLLSQAYAKGRDDGHKENDRVIRYAQSLRDAPLSQEDLLFVKDLANELKTQNRFGTAGPVIYQVREKVKTYGMDLSYADDKVIIFPHSDNHEGFESLDDAKQYVIEYLLDDGNMSEDMLACKKHDIDELWDHDELMDYCNDKLNAECYITGVATTYKLTGFFLTYRAYKKHIEENSHHYNDTVHSYCDSAGWRNPEMVRLMQIIERFADVKEEPIDG